MKKLRRRANRVNAKKTQKLLRLLVARLRLNQPRSPGAPEAPVRRSNSSARRAKYDPSIADTHRPQARELRAPPPSESAPTIPAVRRNTRFGRDGERARGVLSSYLYRPLCPS